MKLEVLLFTSEEFAVGTASDVQLNYTHWRRCDSRARHSWTYGRNEACCWTEAEMKYRPLAGGRRNTAATRGFSKSRKDPSHTEVSVDLTGTSHRTMLRALRRFPPGLR